MSYTVEVIRSSRKSMSLELRPDGSVLVRAPLRTSTPRIRAFVEEHRPWIEKRLQALRDNQGLPGALKCVPSPRFPTRALRRSGTVS